MRRLRLVLLIIIGLHFLPLSSRGQSKPVWRAATPAELEAFLPARAPVEKERIETELRTATGITSSRGKTIAAVVLITAGYSAEGKYSHYLLTQVGLRIGRDLQLPPGPNSEGWKRTDEGLLVHIYDATSGSERGTVIAQQLKASRVEPFKIWPPDEQTYFQIGRFFVPYAIAD